MAGQCRAAGQARPRVAFTRGANGGTGSNPTWDALTRTCSATSGITTAHHTGVSQRRRGEAQARPRCRNPCRGGQRISSQRGRSPNPIGGSGRWRQGASFAPGGGGGNHRRRPGSSGGGGDRGRRRGLGERGVRARGTRLGQFDRPRTQSVGLDPARSAGLANGSRPNFR
jgi:hypothetical protein